MEELLKAYSQEIGTVYGSVITLPELIDSHRTLRTRNARNNAEFLAELESARQCGFREGMKQGTDEALCNRLKGMTVLELVALLHDRD